MLVPLSREQIQQRLASETFELDIDGVGGVMFPASWPGRALAMFSVFLVFEVDPIAESYVANDREDLLAVGQLGTTSELGDGGEIDIGYGFGVIGRGYATEAVAALVDELLSRDSVSIVTATTAIANVASQRVLEKNGFVHTGTDWSADDDLLVWQRRNRS